MKSTNRKIASTLVALVAVGTLFALVAANASAHVQIKKTKPSGKSSTSIGSASITFTGPIRSGKMKVYGPGHKRVSKGRGGRDPRNISKVRVSLRGGLKPGKYKAKATIVSADGHEQKFEFGFKLKG